MNPIQSETEQFAPVVLLLDERILNETVGQIRRILSSRLGRPLPDLDLISWLEYVALDAGIRPGSNKLQVLLVAHELHSTLRGVIPSSLAQLDGKACTSNLGEWNFSVVPSAHLTSGHALFANLMELVMDASEVETLLLLPFPDEQATGEVATQLTKIYDAQQTEQKEKRVVYFHLQPLPQLIPCPCESLVFSLMKALGIREEDFQ